ncbi:MAG TPA: hypothetical protein VHT75_08675 [Acidimicrobiales bacterium]|jgi:hypothetical protein|nr:hypothetical protein [Acidimicrobiales bacterium]
MARPTRGSDSPAASDAIVAFNQVLSEILDVVSVAKQADRKVPGSHPLHAELDRLLNDLVAWSRRLMEEDDLLGVSALNFMPSAAGRHPPNRWPGAPTDEQVITVLGELLGRLAGHLDVAAAEQTDDAARAALQSVAQELAAHRQALAGCSGS